MQDRQGASGGSGRRESYDEVVAENERLRARIAELERLVEEIRRGSKRQAAPFSKGKPKDEPARPGRKPGKGHGRHGHRMAPADVDSEVDAPAPQVCPDCGGTTMLERIASQYQTELAEPRPVTTCFKVHVRRCGSCGKRVQGRHRDQTSDALGAAAAQVGPQAMAWGTWLHYSLGLSFAKTSALLGRLPGCQRHRRGHLFIVGIDEHRSRPHPPSRPTSPALRR